MDLTKLKAEFPREAIHWRAQSVTKDGSKAMALAYLDARDVMDRLDEVCGQNYWQDEYTCLSNSTMICRIGICAGEWVWKSDGAGKTDVEAEKGQISDAFKRAAVKWGIGRYLYDMPTIWVPCESRENGKDRYGNTKWQWQKWTADPWGYVKGKPPQAAPPPPKQEPSPEARELAADNWVERFLAKVADCDTPASVNILESSYPTGLNKLATDYPKKREYVDKVMNSRRGMLSQAPAAGEAG